MEDGKKVCVHCFLADQKIASAWKKCCCFLHPTKYKAQATSSCFLLDTLRVIRNAFKVSTVNFANLLSLLSFVKKVCTRSKNSQGT